MRLYSQSVTSTAYKLTRTLAGVKCDVCGQIMKAKQYGDVKYYEVTTGHRDWGNDSCDSIEIVDICPKCLTQYVDEYFKKERSTTAYLDIETNCVYPHKDMKIVDNPPKDGEIAEEDHDL